MNKYLVKIDDVILVLNGDKHLFSYLELKLFEHNLNNDEILLELYCLDENKSNCLIVNGDVSTYVSLYEPFMDYLFDK